MPDEAKYVYEGEHEIQAALEAGRALGEPRELEKQLAVYSVVVPKDATHKLVRAPAASPEYNTAPDRAHGTYRPATVDALIAVVRRHHHADATTLWVHPTTGRIVAVLNDAHPDAGPAWRDHRAELQLTHTPEWRHWAGKDGQLMTQQAFAEHVEDGVTEIAEPAAADMLELAQTFHAKQSAAFRSATRLHDGVVQLQYDEEIEASAGRKGELSIPTEFKLAIAPFIGEDPYSVTARLRYRVSSGNLSIGYKLAHPDRVVRDALDQIAEKLTGEFPNVFIGEPPTA